MLGLTDYLDRKFYTLSTGYRQGVTVVPLVVTPVSLFLFGIALIVNIFASMGLGFLRGGYAIFASEFEWALPTYVSGLLMVFSEALFPVTTLPIHFQISEMCFGSLSLFGRLAQSSSREASAPISTISF